MVPASSNPLAVTAVCWLDTLKQLASTAELNRLDAIELLEARSVLFDLYAQPGRSPGGSCRFLRTTDGVIALHLSRDDDWALLPAWFQVDQAIHAWDGIETAVAERSRHELLPQGIDLGLAVACTDEKLPASGTPPLVPSSRILKKPRVLDLSTLWAGPLCGQLLWLAGADVTRIESRSRPDPSHSTNSAFHEHLNGGKRLQTVDFHSAHEINEFIGSLRHVDIVIESARPRALPQLGIDPRKMLERFPHLTWVSITAYGRQPFDGMRIGFGDDVGIAAGLSTLLHEHTGTWDVVGDAIADPLTGIRAAGLALSSFCNGGGQLIDVHLVGCVQEAIEIASRDHGRSGLISDLAQWHHTTRC
ncbi:MAG: CoA transferase [Gammaproteobacteria bacterium]|nr:CoA transferase [Gammaproteobacteria bacterium]